MSNGPLDRRRVGNNIPSTQQGTSSEEIREESDNQDTPWQEGQIGWIMSQRHRRRRRTDNLQGSERSNPLVVMAINHLLAFVLIFYILYAICKFGFGWDAIHDPPPETFTIYLPGITDDGEYHRLRGSK